MGSITIEMVAKTISNVGTGAKGTHMLMVEGGELKCTKKTSSPPGDNLIARIAADEIRNGLTGRRWDAIESYLKEYNAKHAT